MGLRTSAVDWIQQRRGQTWGEEEACKEDTGAQTEIQTQPERPVPGWKLLPRQTYTEWALHEAESMLEKIFTENLPKYQRSQTSSYKKITMDTKRGQIKRAHC